MIEQAVDIPRIGRNHDMPAWARRFLDQGKGLNLITWMRPYKRAPFFCRNYLPEFLRVITSHVHFNDDGQAVFRWESESERDEFIAKWNSE